MEQFVETTLEKAAENQSYRATFDFKNKANLLSYVAAWMARENKYVSLREDVRTAMRKCLDEIGLDAPPLDELMDEFLLAKIFERRSGRQGGVPLPRRHGVFHRLPYDRRHCVQKLGHGGGALSHIRQ